MDNYLQKKIPSLKNSDKTVLDFFKKYDLIRVYPANATEAERKELDKEYDVT